MRVCWCWGQAAASALPAPAKSEEQVSGFRLLFSRRWPAVEKRAKAVHGQRYTAPPDAQRVLSTFFSSSCELGAEHITAAGDLDDADPAQIERLQLTEPPLFVVDGCWPVVMLRQGRFVAAALPFVEVPPSIQDKASVILNSPDVSSSLSFLEEMLALAERLERQTIAVIHSELSMFISLACATGMYDGLSYRHVSALLSQGTETSKTAMPSWRIGSHAGAKPALEFFVTETITASQQQAVEYHETMIVSGVVSCRATLPGKPEVTATIASSTDLSRSHVHHCVQQSRSAGSTMQRTVTFIPPIETFDLLHYKVVLAAEPLEPPLLGSYQMTSSGDQSRVSLTITLRRSERYTGPAFEGVQVTLPFFNRGCVSNHTLRSSAGTATAPRNSNVVVWRLDRHFSGKHTSASLQADLLFDRTRGHGAIDDPFCTGVTAYADVRWTAHGKTLSNTYVNLDTVRVQPPLTGGRLRPSLTTTLQAGDYRIWNVHGKTRQCIPPAATGSSSSGASQQQQQQQQ